MSYATAGARPLKQPARDYWESKTEKYGCWHPRLARMAELVAARRPSTVLDVGCSTGHMGRWLESAVPGLQYYGCELSEAAVRAIGRPTVVQRDLNAEGLPFAGEQFDCLIASGICEYVVDLADFFEQACERLRPGGALVVSYVNIRHIRRRIRALLGRPLARNPTWQEIVSIGQFERLLDRAGFDVVERLGTCGRIEAEQRPPSALRRAWTRQWSSIAPVARLFAPQMILVAERRI